MTGLWRATTCMNGAMPTTGTNAELTNTTGKIHVNEAAWTASTCFRDRPMQAEIHENVKPTAITSTIIQQRVDEAVLEPEPDDVADHEDDR